jgi:2-C-methyl-D-erythritol 4-phosphate cytidylyltransferase
VTEEDAVKLIHEASVKLVHEAIRTAHYSGTLQHLIADALGKNAVFIAFIDVEGAVSVHADNRANVPTTKRDRSMLLQMRDLFSNNMEEMMRKAGKAESE